MVGDRVKNTYELFNVHHDSNECDLLLLNSLGDQIVLEQMRIVDVRADVALVCLLSLKSLL